MSGIRWTYWCPYGCGKKVSHQIGISIYVCKGCGATFENKKKLMQLLAA